MPKKITLSPVMRDLSVTVLIFLALFLSIDLPIFFDEFWYLWKSGSPGHLLNILGDEGKKPFPLWVGRLFLHTLEFNVFTARLGSMVVAAISSFFLLRILRKKDLPLFLGVFSLFSSSYFVFYSRMYLYEIYIIFSILFLIYGALNLKESPKGSAACLFFASFFGSMTKLSFLGIFLILPFILVLELSGKESDHFRWKDFLKKGIIRSRFLLGVGSAMGGIGLALLCIIIPGYWHKNEEFRRFVSRDLSEVLARPDLLKIYPYDVEILLTDIGPGLLAGFFLCLIYCFARKQFFLAASSVFSFAFLFFITTKFPKWVWARYLVALYPVLLYFLFCMLNRIKEKQIKFALISLIIVLQFWPMYRTTIPLMANIKNLHWTMDEMDQNINGGGLYGFDLFAEKIFELSRDHQIELVCLGPGATSETMCHHMNILYRQEWMDRENRNIFANGKPLKKLWFIKAREMTVPQSDPKVVLFFDQSIQGSEMQPEDRKSGYLYLVDSTPLKNEFIW